MEAVDKILKIYEQGGSENKEKLAAMLMTNIGETMERGFHQGMAHGTLYKTINQQKAILDMYFSDNSEKSQASFLEAAGVSARELLSSKRNRAKLPIFSNKTATMDKVLEKQEKLDEELINFSNDPMKFRDRLKELPSDCVIVQLSEIYPGQRLFPPEVLTRPLHLSRFCCGENFADCSVQNIAQPQPLPAARNSDILQELKAVVRENVEAISFGNKQGYRQLRLQLEERFRVVLEAIQDWLGPWRCLLLGQIASSKVSSEWNKAIRKLANELNIKEEDISKFSMLAQCSNAFKKVDLVHGLQAVAPKTAKNMVEFVSKAKKLVKELAQQYFGPDLTSLKEVERHPVILIVDNNIFAVPWEQLDILQSQPMSRMPCLALIHAIFKAPDTLRELDPGSTYFVVDPDSNLPRTSARLKSVFEARKEWSGTVGKVPDKTSIEKHLQEDDIYIYCGHGSGSHLVHNYDNMKLNTAAVLMGCSSADLNKHGVHWEMNGAPLNFLLSGSPICLGNLWTVTDTDSDKMTVRLVETWLPSKNKDNKYRMELCSQDLTFAKVFEDLLPQTDLLRALRSAQFAATSRIISSAFIAIGIPVYVKHHSK